MKPDFDYVSMMNAKELVPITSDWSQPIKESTLIGFKGLGKKGGITAAYQVLGVVDNVITFVLAFRDGRPSVVDCTYFGMKSLYINKEPIVIDMEMLRLQRKMKLKQL